MPLEHDTIICCHNRKPKFNNSRTSAFTLSTYTITTGHFSSLQFAKVVLVLVISTSMFVYQNDLVTNATNLFTCSVLFYYLSPKKIFFFGRGH